MKYIRTYGDYNSWKTDYSDPNRGFRLKPTLYKYSDVGVESKILLELDDPRKHGDSTYMEITLGSDTEFSFYIGNKSGDTQTTMTCTIDWGDGTVETKTITADDKGFKLAHSYVTGSYKIELYGVERDYSIPGDSVYQCSLISLTDSVKRVVLSNSVVSIGGEAFSGCSSLTSVYIPEGVTSIGVQAFGYCSSLTSINIPDSITSIGEFAFYGCSSLTSINIPDSVTSIGVQAFGYCPSLVSVYISEGVTSIGDYTFSDCSSLTSINIPDSITSIGEFAFYGCSSLTSISSLNTTAPTLGSNVFTNLPTNGTLYIKPGATGYDAWLNALPSGWKIVESL